MRIELGILADAANLSDGKLNLMGEFQQVALRQLPGVLPRFVFVVRLEGTLRGEAGKHQLIARLMDAKGRLTDLIPQTTFELNALDGLPDVGRWMFLVNVEGVIFFDVGVHRIEVEVDGQRIGTIPFNVAQHP